MWSNILSAKEADYLSKTMSALKIVPWAKPLLDRISQSGGLKSETMPLLFEARFAYELHRAGVSAEYEYSTGIGNSTVEFKLSTSPVWLVELVSIRESEPVKRATQKIGDIYHSELSTDAEDPLQSEEAEMIRVGSKIGEKVFLNGEPTKFPIPDKTYHLILIDMRGYLGFGGDHLDYKQIALGAKSGVWPTHYWNGAPIKGLFDKSNNKISSARYIRERIHFIGFIKEENYKEGEIRDNAFYAPNPNLITNKHVLKEIWKTYPLQSMTKEAW